MTGDFLLQAIVFLIAAIVCVPIARRLGMGSVLGYLIAGVLIGPYVLGFVGEEGKDIMHFAEFGVVVMLFLIGLEIDPSKFWRMRQLITGMGITQIVLTASILAGIGLYFLESKQAIAVGLALAMSSTAIVLQSLKEKGEFHTLAGRSSFAVLLMQDIAVIPILAILPLLASESVVIDGDNHSILEGLHPWLRALAVIGVVVGVMLVGRFLAVPILRMIAKTYLRELLTASALLIVVGIAYLMEVVGLSPALGTFLAGVVLANSEFKHELESDLEPFKGLLLGLFFIAVGASIDFPLIFNRPSDIATLVGVILLVKMTVLLIIGKMFRLKLNENFLFAFGLSQVGEFAFVLFSYMDQLKILKPETTGLMMVSVAMSMAVTPLLLLFHAKIITPLFSWRREEEQESDLIEENNPVILAGFAHFGSSIGRFLRANGIEATILDNDASRVELLRQMGFKVYYGDATRFDLLESAGAKSAKILITAIDSLETNLTLVETCQKHFPHLHLLVRSKHRYEAYELMDKGVMHIYRESIDTALRLGVDALVMLGKRRYTALRSAQNFLIYDERALKKLAAARHDQKEYISQVREEIEQSEKLLKGDSQVWQEGGTDHAWDGEHMRKSLQG